MRPARLLQIIAGVATATLGGVLIYGSLRLEWGYRSWAANGPLTVLLMGAAAAMVGLLLIALGLWPSSSGNRYQFFLPVEGRMYVAIMTFLLCGSQIGSSNMLLMVFVAMAGPWVVNGWITYAMMRKVSLERTVPERIMAGDACPVRLEFTNHKRWLPCWVMRVYDPVTFRDARESAQVLFVHVPRRQRRIGEYHLRTLRRGRYAFGPLHLSTRFPLGMVQRGRQFAQFAEVLVYPRMGRLATRWLKRLSRETELAHQPRSRAGIFHDDLHQLREYRVGDDTRLIHWRTSARMNELMVCEYHESRDRNLSVIVDVWQPQNPSAAQAEEFERSLRLALTICTEYIRAQRESALSVQFVGAENVLWQGSTSQETLPQLLDLFALAEGVSARTPDEVVERAVANAGGAERILVVTSRSREIRDAVARLSSSESRELTVAGVSPRELQGIYEED